MKEALEPLREAAEMSAVVDGRGFFVLSLSLSLVRVPFRRSPCRAGSAAHVLRASAYARGAQDSGNLSLAREILEGSLSPSLVFSLPVSCAEGGE